MSGVVRDTVDALLGADVEGADRDGVQRMVRQVGAVRAWADAFEVRCARRSKALAAEGRSGSAESTLTDGGRRSGKEAAAAADREQVCASMGSFEDALAEGRVSAGHVDAIARATKRLDDDTRDELVGLEAELLVAAETERVETFERRVSDRAKLLASKRAQSDAEELDRQRAQSKIRRWTDKTTGMCHTLLEIDPIRNATLWSTLDRQVNRTRQNNTDAQIPWVQLQIDTLIDTVVSGAAGEGAGRDNGSDPTNRVPEVTVLIDHATAVAGLHERSVCELEDGTPLPLSTARRTLCDCEVLPVILNGHGVALEEGRSRRTVTRSQRRALRAMHRTCAHPGCAVGFSNCRIHHVRWWWRDLGPTNLDNLIPLCERHHHLVHEGRWELTMTPDRTATWTRPDGSVAHKASSLDRAPNGLTPRSGTDRESPRSGRTPSCDPDSGP